jgi:hypothetical protein
MKVPVSPEVKYEEPGLTKALRAMKVYTSFHAELQCPHNDTIISGYGATKEQALADCLARAWAASWIDDAPKGLRCPRHDQPFGQGPIPLSEHELNARNRQNPSPETS